MMNFFPRVIRPPTILDAGEIERLLGTPGREEETEKYIPQALTEYFAWSEPPTTTLLLSTLLRIWGDAAKIIGSGMNGCIYRPPLPSVDQAMNEKYMNGKYVMKVSSITEDLVFDKRLKDADPLGIYFLPFLDCTTLAVTPNAVLCKLSPGAPVSACYMRYGGINLQEYLGEIDDEERPRITLKQFIDMSKHLLTALNLLHTVARLSHGDIRDENILISTDSAVPRIIDFDYVQDLTRTEPKREKMLRKMDTEAMAGILYSMSGTITINSDYERETLKKYTAFFENLMPDPYGDEASDEEDE